MTKRKTLGRGLSALIPQEDIINKSKEKVEFVSLDDIRFNPNNARKTLSRDSLNDLGESIKKYGIIQPLVVIKKDKQYELIAGERRLRASKIVGLKEVPVIVKNLERKDIDMISMVENIQREDLNPLEEALAYRKLMDDYELTQGDLSEKIGKSRTYIANIVRLLSLDEKTIRELELGNISSSQARALLAVKDLSQRHRYLELFIKKELTVNELEKKSNASPIKKKKDIYIKDLEDRLKEALGAKVKINKTQNSWKLNIEFFDDSAIEDFIRKYYSEEEV